MNDENDAITTTIGVAGMSCGHCIAAVTKELTAIGASEVAVDLEAGQVTFESDGPIALDAVRAAVDEAGFELAG